MSARTVVLKSAQVTRPTEGNVRVTEKRTAGLIFSNLDSCNISRNNHRSSAGLACHTITSWCLNTSLNLLWSLVCPIVIHERSMFLSCCEKSCNRCGWNMD